MNEPQTRRMKKTVTMNQATPFSSEDVGNKPLKVPLATGMDIANPQVWLVQLSAMQKRTTKNSPNT